MSAIGLCFKRYPQAVMGLIYHPLRNDQADWLSVAIRSAHGGICVNKRHVLRHLLQYKRQGKRSLFGYISDQAPKWENIHLWLDFLGHDTPVFTGGERIMSKMDDGVFYLDLSRPRRGYYVVEFKLISQHAAQEEENAITHSFFQMLEDSIRRNPAYYLWTHDRWKRTREEFNELFINVNGHNILKDQQKTTEG
jgi:KDO2-lipid IV(A) lauroyltransferase